MAGRIRGAPRPNPGPRMSVHRVTTAQMQYFTILSTAVFGQWIHFYGGRSHECVKDKKECDLCKRQWVNKWRGYLHAYSHEQKREVFIELTPTAVEMIEALVDEERTFRGVVCTIQKTKGGRYGRYQIAILSRDVDAEKLPAEKDPYPVLRFLWACKNTTGQEIPTPV